MEHLNVAARILLIGVILLLVQPAPAQDLKELEAAVEEAQGEFFRLKQKHSRVLVEAITTLRSGHGRHAVQRERECRAEMLRANRDWKKAVRLLTLRAIR
jgi:hypothetical protein